MSSQYATSEGSVSISAGKNNPKRQIEGLLIECNLSYMSTRTARRRDWKGEGAWTWARDSWPDYHSLKNALQCRYRHFIYSSWLYWTHSRSLSDNIIVTVGKTDWRSGCGLTPKTAKGLALCWQVRPIEPNWNRRLLQHWTGNWTSNTGRKDTSARMASQIMVLGWGHSGSVDGLRDRRLWDPRFLLEVLTPR